jgi:hypothetical protein
MKVLFSVGFTARSVFRSWRARRLAMVLVAGCCCWGTPVWAAVVNGTFDNGLVGWETSGSIFSTGQLGVITDQGAPRAVLWQMVLLSPGLYFLEFDVLGSLAGVGGEGTLPDVFFASLYFASDPQAFDPLNQAGFDQALAVADLDFRGITALGLGVEAGPSPKGRSYVRITMPFELAGGGVAPLFEVNNLNFITGDSIAAVDNVSIRVVPEPSAALLCLVGSALLLGRRGRPV